MYRHTKSFLSTLLALSLTACSPPTPLTATAPFSTHASTAEAPCEAAHRADNPFLPITHAPSFARIVPAQNNDCGFYNWAWQTFLHVTQPAPATGRPAFMGYEALEAVFGLPAAPGELPLLNGGFRQAGDQVAILVDQNRNPIFYSIHTNAVFNQFVRSAGLNQRERLLKAPEAGGLPADLEFPAGAVELKAAWQIVEPGESLPDYYTLTARVPVLKQEAGKITATGATRVVKVALLALHVVGVVEDHPEFVWATFEHANAAGALDLAPAARQNPGPGLPELVNPHGHYALFGPGSAPAAANQVPEQYQLEAETQKLTAATPIYRAYPASLGETAEEDQGLKELNQAVADLFTTHDRHGQDPRRHYRMAGAVWLDQPGAQDPNGVFKAGRSFEHSAATPILAGENHLSSVALESFAQHPGYNCFSCHNTQAKNLGQGLVLPARRINVSGVLGFILQQQQG
jgi:hypothetical protein